LLKNNFALKIYILQRLKFEQLEIKSLEIRQLNEHRRLAIMWLDEFSASHGIHTRREAEKRGTQFLLQQLFPSHIPVLKYHANGKPFVENTAGGISISHSHNLLAVLADSRNVHTGLDVEMIRDKVLKIRHKFLSEEEKKFVPADNIIMHIMAWCVKETLYKIHSEGKIDFIEHLQIEKFNEDSTEISGSCKADISFAKQFTIEKLDGYIMAWPKN
jgi:4'-phosphopantetheinyl transferase